MPQKVELYDVTEQFSEEIAPLVRELARKCYEARIPCFIAMAVKEDGQKTVYENEMVGATVAGRCLSDDRIARFVNVINGYNVVHPNDVVEMDEMEF